MTIDELHDYCRCHEGLTDEDRKAVADWREKHWKDTK
nr:MAG TPA: hypothetical protein [Caudoviricetes sp.]